MATPQQPRICWARFSRVVLWPALLRPQNLRRGVIQRGLEMVAKEVRHLRQLATHPKEVLFRRPPSILERPVPTDPPRPPSETLAPQAETTRPDLFRAGNAQGPSPLRVGPGKDVVPDASGNVQPTSPPSGLSTFDSIDALPTKGRVWKLPSESPLPDGVGATPDAPPPSHWSIGNTVLMSLEELLTKLGQLPWVDTGIKKK